MSTARDFGEVKAAAIALLKATVTRFKAAEPFAGQIEDAIAGRVTGFPLLAVLFVGEDFETVDGPTWHEINEYSVGMFFHSLKGAADLNAQAEEGVREVKQCLVNARLADNLEPVVPLRTRIVPAACSSTTLVYAFDFSVALDQEYQWPANGL